MRAQILATLAFVLLFAGAVARDLFEVFRREVVRRTAPRRVSPVNLFREVFAILAENEALRERRAADDFFAYVFVSNSLTATPRVYRTVKDGKVLPRWEPFTPGTERPTDD